MRQTTVSNLRKNLKEYTDNPPVEVINGVTGEVICRIVSTDDELPKEPVYDTERISKLEKQLRLKDALIKEQEEIISGIKNSESSKNSKTEFDPNDGWESMQRCVYPGCRSTAARKDTLAIYDNTDWELKVVEDQWLCDAHIIMSKKAQE